jgi:hypothetical protein
MVLDHGWRRMVAQLQEEFSCSRHLAMQALCSAFEQKSKTLRGTESVRSDGIVRVLLPGYLACFESHPLMVID